MSDDEPPFLEQKSGEDSLWLAFLGPIAGICVVLVVALVFTGWAFPDHFVVDYYPEEDGRPPIAVIRWPSRQLQLKPIVLPRALSMDHRWQGKQPKRASLRADTILPAGEVLEATEKPPPGRFLLQIGAQRIEVSPDSDWSQGEMAQPGNG